ncbi:MAG: HD domain-containing protein [Nitrospiraceae bacterium]|nr:HD domain-containing protein [Nitrospirota bacterium]MDA8339691.1 HD domain-containing protein [Nitrospiraceae bacterium]
MGNKKIHEAFFRMSEIFADSKGMDEMCNAIANLITSFQGFHRCIIIMKGEHSEFKIVGISETGRDRVLEFMNARCTGDGASFIRQILKNKNTATVCGIPKELGVSSVQAKAIICPLIYRGEGNGILIAEADNFDDTDVKLIDAISRYASIGTENQMLHMEGLESRVGLVHEIETLHLMYEIGKEILSNLKTDEIVETVVQMIRRIIPCDGATVALFDSDRNVFHVSTSWGTGIDKEKEIGKDDSPFYSSLKSGRPFYQHDITLDFHAYPRQAEWASEKNVFSYFCAPLSVKSNFLGVLILSSVRPAWFTSDHIKAAEKIATQVSIALENARLMENIEEIFLGTVTSLVSAIDAKSKWTKGHSLRVADYAMKLGSRVGLKKDTLEKLQLAAILHDIGKIGTYEAILDKPGDLTSEEVELIHKHPSQGAEILMPLKSLRDIIPIMKHHHERYDGSGYPDGLAGDDIPLEARILAVADVYDAITADRPYRIAMTRETAIDELKSGAGAKFDPTLVRLFVDILNQD